MTSRGDEAGSADGSGWPAGHGDDTVVLTGGRAEAAVLVAVATGGAAGAAARYGLAVAVPGGQLPWATLLANVTGCLLMGVLLETLERRPAHRLVRPFAGTGVLGGYTTFSTYAVETLGLLEPGRALLAAAYLVGTPLAAVAAVAAGAAAARVAWPPSAGAQP